MSPSASHRPHPPPHPLASSNSCSPNRVENGLYTTMNKVQTQHTLAYLSNRYTCFPHHILLLQLTQHDSTAAAMLPHHSPEVIHCVLQGTLCGYVGIPLLVALEEWEERFMYQCSVDSLILENALREIRGKAKWWYKLASMPVKRYPQQFLIRRWNHVKEEEDRESLRLST